METAHIIKGTKCHGKTQKEGNNFDWRTLTRLSTRLHGRAGNLRTDKEDFRKQKSRKQAFKARKEKMHFRESEQQEQRSWSVKQYGVFLEGEA